MFTAGFVIAVCVAVLFGLLRQLKRERLQLRRQFQEQIDSLAASVSALEKKALLPTATTPAPPAVPLRKVGRFVANAPERIPAQASVAAAEALEPIAQTVATLLGDNVRIRSITVLPASNASVGPWAQQGRMAQTMTGQFAAGSSRDAILKR